MVGVEVDLSGGDVAGLALLLTFLSANTNSVMVEESDSSFGAGFLMVVVTAEDCDVNGFPLLAEDSTCASGTGEKKPVKSCDYTRARP